MASGRRMLAVPQMSFAGVSRLSQRSDTITNVWTTRRILEWTIEHLSRHGSETPRLDAEVLLAHAWGCPRIQLYTRYDDLVQTDVRTRMRELVKRRAAAEPVAYLVGHREFFSLDFRVTPDVLIPRPDTETLVVEALERLKPLAKPNVLDFCTGCGCVAVAVAKNHPGAQLTATDVSPAALNIARGNAERHGVAERIHCLEGDLSSPLPAEARFDMIVSNPPYVRTEELPELDPQVSRHEPRLALDGGPDGLDVIRRIIVEAPRHLIPDGRLLLECSPEQAAAVSRLLSECGRFVDVRTCADLSGTPRVVLGRSSG